MTSARLGGLLMSAVKSRSASSWTIGTWEGGETLAGAETNSRTNPSLTSLPSDLASSIRLTRFMRTACRPGSKANCSEATSSRATRIVPFTGG